MSTTKDVMIYLMKNYPFKHELSNARLTKLVYLSDWRHALIHNSQITEIQWYYDNYGPFVFDILTTAENTQDVFKVDQTVNLYGDPKKQIGLVSESVEAILSDSEKAAVDFVIDKTNQLTWESFIRLVYSTYPIMSSERYSQLNLLEKATEYKAVKSRNKTMHG